MISIFKASIFTKIEYEDKNNWEPMFESTKYCVYHIDDF